MVARRGMSAIELLMALAITGMVAAAISSMWSAISAGERSRRDNRAFTVRSYTAKNRLSAYVARSRCVLSAGDDMLVLWLDDARESGTVHASELRWFLFNGTSRALDVYFVRFPAAYSEVEKALQDTEYPVNTDWSDVLGAFATDGLVSNRTLVDGLESVTFSLDAPAALDAQEVSLVLEFPTESPGQFTSQSITAAILAHAVPANP